MGRPRLTSGTLGSGSSSASIGSFLPVPTLGGSSARLECLGPCHPHGRHGFIWAPGFSLVLSQLLEAMTGNECHSSAFPGQHPSTDPRRASKALPRFDLGHALDHFHGSLPPYLPPAVVWGSSPSVTFQEEKRIRVQQNSSLQSKSTKSLQTSCRLCTVSSRPGSQTILGAHLLNAHHLRGQNTYTFERIIHSPKWNSFPLH